MAEGHSIPVPIHRHREGSVNATTITLARLLAVKAVKRQMQAQGLKVAHIAGRIIVASANDYLREHPELIEEAAETVRLGHRNLQSTARYTALAPNRFARFWQD